MVRNYPPRVVSVSPVDCCCSLHLHDNTVVRLDLSLPSLEAYLQQNGFPPLTELIARDLIVAFPLPLRMTANEWETISTVLQESDTFRKITDRFPRLLHDIHRTYEDLQSMPHYLYGGVGMYVDGKGVATLYTSHPLDFQRDVQKGQGWYFNLLASGDNHLVWTHVNVDTNTVETQTDHRAWHYVTNTSTE